MFSKTPSSLPPLPPLAWDEAFLRPMIRVFAQLKQDPSVPPETRKRAAKIEHDLQAELQKVVCKKVRREAWTTPLYPATAQSAIPLEWTA
jgi:hypothetical protein